VEAVNCHERPRSERPPSRPRRSGRPAAISDSRTFVPDDADPHGIVQALTARLAPGSYVVVSHGTADFLDAGGAKAARVAYEGASAPGVPRSRDDIERFLDGLELVPPGVTDVTAWRPGPGRTRLRSASPPVFYGGAARITVSNLPQSSP
jgi:S-adenosyl methyltransferase